MYVILVIEHDCHESRWRELVNDISFFTTDFFSLSPHFLHLRLKEHESHKVQTSTDTHTHHEIFLSLHQPLIPCHASVHHTKHVKLKSVY